MNKPKFNSELAAHNIATILMQASIGEIDKEQIPLNMSQPDFSLFEKYSNQYAHYYKGFYDAALRHFNNVLNKDTE